MGRESKKKMFERREEKRGKGGRKEDR